MIGHSSLQSRRNLGRAAIILCATLMGLADVALTQTNGPGNQGAELSKSWIGGYWSGKKFISILIDSKPDAPRAYLLLENAREVSIAGWRLEKNRLGFSIKPGSATLSFDGVVNNGIARGTVRGANTQAPFHLLNFRDLSTQSLDQFTGSYAFDNRRHLLIQRIGVVLKYEDSESGRFGFIAPIDDTTFVGGPGQLMFDPVEVTISFAADGKIIWRNPDGSTRVGRKVIAYREEQIVFQNGGVSLSGTLFLPNGPGPHPAVVGVHGSGGADRTGFGAIPAQLATEGTAFFAYDKRGTGKSEGFLPNATFETLAGDVRAALTALAARSDIDRRRIGMWGVSQAGFIAPMIAAGSTDVAFIVLVGPSGLTAALQETYDDEISLRLAGFSEAIVKRASDLQGAINNYYRTGEQREKVEKAINAARSEPWFAATDLGRGLAAAEELPSREIIGDTWWRKIMDYDPTEHWRLVRAPTLVLYGECDDSSPAKESARRIGDALEKAGNRDYTIKLLPMANHGAWIVRECFVTDMPQVPGYEAQYLSIMFTWLRQHGFYGPRPQ
jgi:pimeloyl-ACP methyl ester carboxylesterase